MNEQQAYMEQQNAAFAREYPDVVWLREYLDYLLENLPDVFLEPPTTELLQSIAGGYAARDFDSMYIVGGYILAHMVMGEFEAREQYEVCAGIQQAIATYHPQFYQIHKDVQARHGRG
ncbi:hypothetical protein [Hymenobacter psychrophilus]|uniref:Uncharacterized protein n=1 Tax=Hymenobacter psychrophilus TaxID=651662 RepID=A0A1H3EQH8_9BACT|nr:hypothetical protein [Hymenobacter psychrophilus]SDX80890.1 hypothetical protein SAMN04488069_103255 [Hymenobacter psychrophilus]